MDDTSNNEQYSRRTSIGGPDHGEQHIPNLENGGESGGGSVAASISTLNPEEEQRRKAMRQRKVLEWMVSILCMSSSLISAAIDQCFRTVFANIPCISPLEVKRDAGCHYFLPWVLLPRYLAARSSAIVGFPAMCKPIVEDNVVSITQLMCSLALWFVLGLDRERANLLERYSVVGP
jgi:hypothetical protein